MTDIRIAVVTGTSGDISLHSATRLVKPALLYADHVTLYSPVAALLQSAAAVGLSDELTLAALREVGPLIDPSFPASLQVIDELVAKRHKTRSDMQLLIGLKKRLRDGAAEILAKAEEMIEEAGGTELIPAMEAGLITLDPLVREDEVDTSNDDLVFDAFIARLRELLRDNHAYPLFDDQIGDLVRATVAEDVFEMGEASVRRGKQVSTAARFMQQLPAFPAATVAEILDIRDELRSPLVRFRSAIIEMERLIDAAAYEPDFAAEVEDLFNERVAPALAEINELIRDNASLRQLVGEAIADSKTILSAVLTLGVTTSADFPTLVAAALDVAVPVAAVTARAAWTQSVGAREIERRQLFFLYKTNALLDR